MLYRMLAPDGGIYDVDNQNISAGFAQGGVLYDTSDSFSFFNPSDSSVSKFKKSQVKDAINQGLRLIPSTKLVKMVGPDMRLYDVDPDKVSEGLSQGGNIVLNPESLLINPNDPLTFPEEKGGDNTGEGGLLSRPKNWLDAVGEVMDQPLSYLPYLNAVDVFESAKFYQAAKAAKNGTITPEQDSYLNAKLADAQRDKTFGYKVWDIILRMPAYAIEFMTAGGAIKNLSKSAIIKSSGGQLKSLSDDAAERLTARLGLDASALAGVKGAQTTQDLTRIVATAAGPEGIKRAKDISKKVVEAVLDEKVLNVPDSAGVAVANFFLRDTTSGVMQAAGKMGAETAARQAARRAGQSVVGSGISQATLKEAGEAAGASIAQAAGMALGPRAIFSSGRIANSVVANMTPQFGLEADDQGNVKRVLVNEGDDFWPAFAKAYGDMSIENFSESIGENFLFLKGAFGPQAKDFVKSGFLARHAKDLTDKVTESLPATTVDRASVAKRMVTNFLFGKNGERGIVERLGFNGYFAELGEEAVGGVLRQALGITPVGLPSMEDVAAMAIGFALNPLAIGAVAYESANQVIAETTSKVMDTVKSGEAFRSAEALAPVAEEIRTVADKLSRRPTGFFDGILTSAFYKPYARAQARAIGKAFQPGLEGQTPIERAGLLDPTEQGSATPPLDTRQTVFMMEALGRRIQKERERLGSEVPASEILPDATLARMLHTQFGVQFAAADVDPDLRNKLNDLQKRGLVYAPKGYGRSGLEHLVIRAENGQSPLSEEEFQQALAAYPYLGDVVDLTKNENITSRVRDLLEFAPDITEQDFLVQLLGSEEAEKLTKGEDGQIRFDSSNPRLVALMESIFYPEQRSGVQTPVSVAAQARSSTDMALAAQSTFYRVLKIAKSLPRDMKFRIGSTMVIEGTADQISNALNKGYKDLEKAGQRVIRMTPEGQKVFRVMVNGLNFPGAGTAYGDIFIGTAAARFGDRNPALAHEIMESVLRYEIDRNASNTDVDVYAAMLQAEYAAIARSKVEDQEYSGAEKAAAQQVLALFSENSTELVVHQLEVSLGLVSGQDLESFSSPLWLLRNRIKLPGTLDKGPDGLPVLGIMDVFRRALEYKYGQVGGYTAEQLDKLLKDLGAVRSLQDLNDGGVIQEGQAETTKKDKGKERKAKPTPTPARELKKVETVNLAGQSARYADSSPEVKALVQRIIERQRLYGEVASDSSFYYVGGKQESNRIPRMTVISTQAAGLRTPPPSRAAVLGTEFHNAMSQLLAGVAPDEVAKGLVKVAADAPAYTAELDSVTETVARLRNQLSGFFNLDPKLWITEQFLADTKRRAAGTIDAIYFNPETNKFEVYDWKTLLGVPWDASITDVAKVELIARNLEAMREEIAVRDIKEMEKEGAGRQTERQALKFKYQVSGYSDLLSQIGVPVSQLSDEAYVVPVSRTEKDLDKADISDFQIDRKPVSVKVIPDVIGKMTEEIKKVTPVPPPTKVKGAVKTGLLTAEEFDAVPTYNPTVKEDGVYAPRRDKVPLLKVGSGLYEDSSVPAVGPRKTALSGAFEYTPKSFFPDPKSVGEVKQLLVQDIDIETGKTEKYAATQAVWERIQESGEFTPDAGQVLFPNGFVLENNGQFLGVGPEATIQDATALIDRFLKGEIKEGEGKPPAPPPPPPKSKTVTTEVNLEGQPEAVVKLFEAIVAKYPKIDKQQALDVLNAQDLDELNLVAENEFLFEAFVESFSIVPGASPQASLSSMSYSFENLPDEQTMQEVINRTRGDLDNVELVRDLPEAILSRLRTYLSSPDLKSAYVVADQMSQISVWNEDTVSPVLRALDEVDFRSLTGNRSSASGHYDFSEESETDDYDSDPEVLEQEGDLRKRGENDIYISEIQQDDLGRRALRRLATQLGFSQDAYIRVYNWFQSPLVRSILTGRGGIAENRMLDLLRSETLFKNDKNGDDGEVRLAAVEYLSGLKRRATEKGLDINLRDRWVTSALVWTDISRVPYAFVQYSMGNPVSFGDVIADRSRMVEQDLFRKLEKSLGTTDEEARSYLEKKVIGEGGIVKEGVDWRLTVPNSFLSRSFGFTQIPTTAGNREDWTKFAEVTSTFYNPETGKQETIPFDWDRVVEEVADFMGVSPAMIYSGFQYQDQWHRNFFKAAKKVFRDTLVPMFEPDASGVAPISSMSRQEMKNEVFNAFHKRSLEGTRVGLPFLYQMNSAVNPEAAPARLREEARAIYSTPQEHLGAHGKRKSGVRGRMLISDELDNNGIQWRVLDYAKGFKRQAFDNDRLTPQSIAAVNKLAYQQDPADEQYWQYFGRGGDSDVILQAKVDRARSLAQLKDLRQKAAKELLASGYTEAELDVFLPSEQYLNSLKGKEPTVVPGRDKQPDTIKVNDAWYQANYALNTAILQVSTMGSPSGAGKKESDFPKRIKSGFTPGFRPVVGVEGGLGDTYNELLIDLEGFEGLIPPAIDGFDLLVSEEKWRKSFGDVIAIGSSVGGSGKWAMMKPIHSERDALRKSSVGLLEFLAQTQPDSLYGALQSLVEQAGVEIDMIRITTAAKVKGKGTKILKLSDLVMASPQPGGTDKFEVKANAAEKAATNLNALKSRDFKMVLDPRSEVEPEADAVPVQLTSTFIDGTGGTVVNELQEVVAILAEQFNQHVDEALSGKLVYLREVAGRYLRDSNVMSLLDAAIQKYGTEADYTVLSPVAYDRLAQALHIFASEYTSRPVLNGLHAVNTPSGAQNDPRVSTENIVRWNPATQDYDVLDRQAEGYNEAAEEEDTEMRMARVLGNVDNGRAAAVFRSDHVSPIEARVFAGMEILQNPEKYADMFKPGQYTPTELRGIILDSERAKAAVEIKRLVQEKKLNEAHQLLRQWVQTAEIDVKDLGGGLYSSVIPSQPIFWMRIPASSGAATGFGRISEPIVGGEAQLILSYEDSEKAGADHDGDKWFVYTLTFDSAGNIIVPRTLESKFKTRGLANQSMIAMVEHFYKNKRSHLKRYEPLDLKRLDEVAREEQAYEDLISKTKETPERTWAFGEYKQMENLRQSQVGVMTRGIFAANNRVYKMFMNSRRPWLSSYNLGKLAETLPAPVKGDIYSLTADEFGSVVFEGKRTAESRPFRIVIGNVEGLNQDIAPQILDTLLQLSVDNDKERKIPLFGLNRESAGVATALLMSNPELHRPGVTEADYIAYFKEIVKFLKSPAVAKFYSMLDGRNSPEGREALKSIREPVTDNAYDFPMSSSESKALRHFLLYGPQIIKEELRMAYQLLSTGRMAVRSNIELYELQNIFLDARNASDRVRRTYPHRRNTATVSYTAQKGEKSNAEYEREALEKVSAKKGNAVLIYQSDRPEPGHSDELFFRLDLRKTPAVEGGEAVVTDEFFEENLRTFEDLLEQIGDLQRELSGINLQIGPKDTMSGGLVLTQIGNSGVSRLEEIAETAPRTYAAIRDAMSQFGRVSSFKLVNAANLVSDPNTGNLNEFGESIEKFISTNRSIMRYSPEVSRTGRALLNRSRARINRTVEDGRPLTPFQRRLRLNRASRRMMTVLMAQALPDNMQITDSSTEEEGVNYRLAEQLEKLQAENPGHPLYSSLIIDEKEGGKDRKRPVVSLVAGYTISKSMDELTTVKNEIRDAILKSEIAGVKVPPVPAEFLSDLYAASLLEFGLDTVNSSRSGNPLRLLPIEVGEMFAKAAWEESTLWNTSSLAYENKLWDRYGDFLTRKDFLPSPAVYEPAIGFTKMIDSEQTARTVDLDAISIEPEITSHRVAPGLPPNILELSANSGASLNTLKTWAIMANRAASPGGTSATRTVRPEMWQLRIQPASDITNEEEARQYAEANQAQILDGTGRDTFIDGTYDYNKPDTLPYSYISARQPRPITAGDAIEQGKKSVLLWTPTSKGEDFVLAPAWLALSPEETKKRQTVQPKAKAGDLIRIRTIGQDGQTEFKYVRAVAAPEEIDYLIADLTAYRPGKNKYPRFENLPSAERLEEFGLENLRVRPAEKFIMPSDLNGRPLSLSYFFPGAGVLASEIALQYKEQTAAVVFTPLVNTLAPTIANEIGEELNVPNEATKEKLKKVDEEALVTLAWSSDGYLDKRLDDWVKAGTKPSALPYQRKIAERIQNLKNRKFTHNVRREMVAFATAADAAAKVRSAFLFAGKGRIVDGQFVNDTETRISLEQAIGLLLANSEYQSRGAAEAIPVFVYDEGTGEWYKMPFTSTGTLTPVEPASVKIQGDHFIFGSSNLGADGKRAMEELFERGFNEPRRIEEPSEPTGPETRGTGGTPSVKPAQRVDNFSRDSVSADSTSLYLFTDNAGRTSGSNPIPEDSWYSNKYGTNKKYPGMTQAVIRGLPNAFPITTMVNDRRTQWTEKQFEEWRAVIDNEIEEIKSRLPGFPGGIKFSLGNKTQNQKIGQGAISKLPARLQTYLDEKLAEIGVQNSWVPETRGTGGTPAAPTGFIGYKGGFENAGKGTPQGDGKDKAMREAANGFIGELVGDNYKKITSVSSTATSAIKFNANGETADAGDGPTISSAWSDEKPAVVMLARNSEFKGKPLNQVTKDNIDGVAANPGFEKFVVGDMPGVDSQFIDYLREKKHPFEVYHTGTASRIKVPEARGTEVQASLSPIQTIKLNSVDEVAEDVEVFRTITKQNEDWEKTSSDRTTYWAADPMYSVAYSPTMQFFAPQFLRRMGDRLKPLPSYLTPNQLFGEVELLDLGYTDPNAPKVKTPDTKVLKGRLKKGTRLLDLSSIPQKELMRGDFYGKQVTPEDLQDVEKAIDSLQKLFPEISRTNIRKDFYDKIKGLGGEVLMTKDPFVAVLNSLLDKNNQYIASAKKRGYQGFIAQEEYGSMDRFLVQGYGPGWNHQAVWVFSEHPEVVETFDVAKDNRIVGLEKDKLIKQTREIYSKAGVQASLSSFIPKQPTETFDFSASLPAKRLAGEKYNVSKATTERLNNWPEDFSPKRQQERSLAFMQDKDIPAFEKTLFEIVKGEQFNMTREKLKQFQRTLVALMNAGPSNPVEVAGLEEKLKEAGLNDYQVQEAIRVTALELPEGSIDATSAGVHREVARYAEWPLSSSTAGTVPKFVRDVFGSGVQAQVTAMSRWMDPRNPFIEGAAEDKVFQQNLDLSNLVMQVMWDNQTEDAQAREILGINGDYVRVMTVDEMSGKLETNAPIFQQKNKFALKGKVTDADRFMVTEFASAVQELLGTRIKLQAEKGELPTFLYLKDRTLDEKEYKKPYSLTWDDVLRAEQEMKTSKAKEFKDLQSYGTIIQGLGAKVLNRKVAAPELNKHDKELFEAGKKELFDRLRRETKVIWGRKGPMTPEYKKDDAGNVIIDEVTKEPVLIGYRPQPGDEESVASIEKRWKSSAHYKRLAGEGKRPEELLSLEYWATRIAEEMEDTLKKVNEAHRKTLLRNYIRRRAGFAPRGGNGFGTLTPDEERWLFARQEELKSRTVSLEVINKFKKSRYDGRAAFGADPIDAQRKLYRALTGKVLKAPNQAVADEKIYSALAAELGKELAAFRNKKEIPPNSGLNRVVEGSNLQDVYKYYTRDIMPILNSPVNTSAQQTRQFNTWRERSINTGELPKTLNVFELKKDYTRQVFTAIQKRLVISSAVTTRDMDGRPMAFVSLDPKFDPESPGAVLPPSVLSTMVNNWVEYLRVSGVDYKHNFNAPIGVQVGEIARLLNGMAPGDKRTEGLSGYEKFGEGNVPGVERIFANRGAASSALKMIADSEYHKEISVFGRDIEITRDIMDVTQLTKMTAVSFSAFFPLAGLEQQLGYWGQFPEFWTSPRTFIGKSDFKLGRKNMTEEGVKVRGFMGFVRALFNRTDPDINRLVSDFTRQGLVLDLSKSPDVHLAQLENFMKRVSSFLRIEGKPARKALIPVEHLFRAQLKYSQWLFGEFFPILKMHGAYLIYKQTQNNYQELFGKDWSEAHRTESIKWIAQQMNDGFGGQNWSSYKFATPKVMQTMNLGMFAFNWTMSTANTMGLNVVLEKLGLGPEISAPQIRQMILNNTLMFSIALLIWPNLLQSMIYASFGDPDEKDKPFTLQNEDGRPLHVDITPIMRKMSWYTGDQTEKRRYYVRWGKQIYEVVDGWLTKPVKTFGGKMSLPAQAVWEQIFGSTPGSGGDFAAPFKDAGLAGIFWTQEEGFMGSRLATLAGYTLPFSVQAISGSSKEAFLFGTFASVAKGKSTGAATNDMIKILKTYAWPSVWEELNTKPQGKENLRALAYGIVEAAERNGYPTKQIIDSARSAVLGDLYKRAIKAMDDGDFAEFDRFARGILRVNGTARGLMQSIKSGERLYGQPKLDLTPEMEQAIREAFENP